MADFDYARAWRELAFPAFQRLSQEVLDKLALIAELRSAFKQDSTCDVVLDTADEQALDSRIPDLMRWFDRVDDIDMLCRWARTAYFAVHWQPRPATDWAVAITATAGAGWIFSNLADQALNRRFGLTRNNYRSGARFEVHEGMLRYGVSYEGAGGGWTWQEIGWATRRNLADAQGLAVGPPPRKGSPHKQTYEYLARFDAACERMRKEIGLADPTSAPWLTVTEDYSGDPKVLLLRHLNAEAPAGWAVKDRTHINFRPHPFVIGARHLTGGTLNPDSAPCAQPGGCDLRHNEHGHDTVLVIVAPADADGLPSEGGADWLKHCAEQATAADLPVDGFVFTKAEE